MPDPVPDHGDEPRACLILVGGFGDRVFRSVGQVFDHLAALPGADAAALHYCHHDQERRILALMAAQPPGTPLRLLGHSWGGHAAARVAAGLGDRGLSLDLLVTIDPVSRRIGPRFLARVRAGARRWINVQALGGPRLHRSDITAAVGGRYGRAPFGHADLHLTLRCPHAAFGAMLGCRLPDGRSLLDLAIDRS